MNIKIDFIEDPIYTKMYYMYLYRKIKLGFYQSRGFLISPQAKLKNAAEVVFPNTQWLKEKADYIDSISTQLDKLFLHRFFATTPETSNIDLQGINIPVQTCNAKIRDEISSVLNNPIFIDFLDFLKITNNIKLSIIPVSIGTSCTYTSKIEDDNLSIYVTLRVDLPYDYIVNGIVGAIVIYASKEFERDTDESRRSKNYWLKRQYLVDFLNNNTKLSKLKYAKGKGKFGSGTLRDIAALKQLGKHYEESTKYLTELGVVPHLSVEFEGETLKLEDLEIPLTAAEIKVFKYLHQHKNKICDFEEIAASLWKDDINKYSEYALSKHISNIRQKLKDEGLGNDILHSARGRGYLLSI